jgi:hypothetical protein
VNGALASAVTHWDDATIIVVVPVGAAANGDIVVTVAGQASNPVAFSVTTPNITGLSLSAGPAQVGFVINGASFGDPGGGGSATLNGTALTVISWTDGSITVQVPAGTPVTPAGTTWNVLVLYGVATSNPWPFAVTGAFGCNVNQD